MLLFSNQVELTVCVSQCARTVGTNRHFCASLHQRPAVGQHWLCSLPDLHTTVLRSAESDWRSSGGAQERQRRSCGGAAEELRRSRRSCGSAAVEEVRMSCGGAVEELEVCPIGGASPPHLQWSFSPHSSVSGTLSLGTKAHSRE